MCLNCDINTDFYDNFVTGNVGLIVVFYIMNVFDRLLRNK